MASTRARPSQARAGQHRPIRVVFISPDLRVGGAERHVATLAPALDGDELEVAVICIKRRGALADELEEQGVEVTSLDAGDADFRMLAAFLRLIRELRRRRPDVVVTHALNANVLGRVAAWIAGVRVIAGWKHNCGHLGRHGVLDRWSERLLSPITARYFGVAYGQIPYLVNDLHLDSTKIRVLHNSVQIDQCIAASRCFPGCDGLGAANGDPVVAVVAALREEKDHENLLRAMPEVIRRVPNVRLVLAGDGPRRRALELLARELSLDRHVVFLGTRSDVTHVMRHATLTVMPSFTIECFPFAVLESMAMATPAVCTAVGGLPEMIEDGLTGYLVPPRDSRALAEGIVRILESPDRGKAMGAAARDRLEQRFSFRGATDAARAAIESAADERRRQDA